MRALARRWPLTPAGLALLVLASAALAEGRRSMDLVLTLAGSWGLVVLVLAGAAAALSAASAARRLRRALADPPQELTTLAGTASTTGLRWRPARIPLAARPLWLWAAPAGRVRLLAAGPELVEQVVLPERGRAAEIVRELSAEDVLGLWRFRLRLREPRTVLVEPDPGRVSGTDVAACLASGDLLSHPFGKTVGDPVDARPYTRSDPARLILWKVFARSRELMVRTAEPARAPDRRPVLYLVAGPGDEPAAGTARALWDSGLLGEHARFAADGRPAPTREPEAVREALAGSIAHREHGGGDLATLLADDAVDADDPVVVVCPVGDGPWRAPVAAAVAREPERFVVVAAGDAGPAAEPAPRWQRWIVRPGAPRPHERPFGEMVREAAALAATGARTVLVDRRSGRLQVLASGGVPEQLWQATA